MPFIGELSALGTAFCWSGSSMAFTAASERIGSLQLNINRMILGVFLLLATILVLNLNYSVSSYQFNFLVASGFIGFVIGDSFLFQAFRMIGARVGMLMMSLVPAISTILAYFFLHEIINYWGILGIIITMCGIAMVILQKNPDVLSKYKLSKAGIFYGFMGAFGQAAGMVLAKFAFEEGNINGFVATFIRLASSVVIFLPLAMLAKKYKNPFKVYKKDIKALSFTITGTIFGPFLGVTSSLIAISNTKIGIASTIMATVPVIMLPLVRVIYKEKLTWRSVVGAFLAVGGVAILFLR
ncbi:MAG TPA: DMT family transporter [Ignavibacteriaceae bacterium]|nr:DMT family transporter [Ignavibacteriaceae bacterium]